MTAMTGERRAALRDACFNDLRRFSAALLRGEERSWLVGDMTMAQLRALMALRCEDTLTVSGLGRAVDVSEPAASVLVGQLEDHGLARRGHDAADRRRVLVTLTPEGLERVERLRHGKSERALELLDRLTDDDLESLTRGLAALALAADGEAAGCAGESATAPTAEGGRR